MELKDQRSHINSQNILAAKDKVYKYNLFIHTFNDKLNSGVARDIPGMDFVVSLGGNNWAFNKDIKHNTGTLTDQATTLLHELGHTINLHHGGGDDINDKPDYISRMNYQFQLHPIISNVPLDYSRCTLNNLNENSLNETRGLNISCPEGLRSFMYAQCPNMLNPVGITVPIETGGPVNWNYDGDITDIKVKKNINCDVNQVTKSSLHNILQPYDDWSNVIYVPLNLNFLMGSSNQSDTSNNTTKNTSHNNATNIGNDKIVELLDEPTPRDAQLQALGKIAGIKLFINNISNSTLKQVPTVDAEGNVIEDMGPMDEEETRDPATIAKDYYNMVLGRS